MGNGTADGKLKEKEEVYGKDNFNLWYIESEVPVGLPQCLIASWIRTVGEKSGLDMKICRLSISPREGA